MKKSLEWGMAFLIKNEKEASQANSEEKLKKKPKENGSSIWKSYLAHFPSQTQKNYKKEPP